MLLLAVNGLVAGNKPHSAFEGDEETGFTTKIGHEEDNLKRARYYARSNYEWSFESGPFYGEVEVAQKRTAGTLHTQVGSFRLSEGGLGIPAALRATNRLGELGAQYFVIQLDTAAFGTQEAVDAFMGMIQSGGGAVMSPMAISSYLVRLNADTMAAVQGNSGVTHIEPYHPAFKLNPQIGRQPLSDPFRASSEIYTLDLMLHQGEDAGVVASILGEMGGNVLVAHGSLIRVEIHRTKLAAVAGLEPVFMVEEWQRRFTRAEETTNVVQTGYYFAGGVEAPSPYHAAGLKGEGQVLMVLDSGVSIDAGDMSDTDSVAGTPGPAHRKVLVNASTGTFGGLGDTQSCDDPLLGGSTHGQIVSATALGWATDVDLAYGTGFFAEDIAGNQFSLDGVAPKAKLVFYDGNQTPATGNCGDAENDGIFPGDLYSGGATGSLGASWTNNNAKISNFSWGSPSNTYTSNAVDIDNFLNDVEDAMVFVSAGNAGSDEDSDGIPDLGTLGTPATCKNCLAIGASGNANSNGGRRTERDRAFFSSVGPTDPAVAGGRIAPQLMAPGQERGGLGVPSEFACRSNDNDQTGTVECDVSEGSAGTSFASPAAAGAALLVRDYFASGFYPDGTSLNPSNAGDQRANISGSLVRAILVASADFLAFPNNVLGANNTIRYRFNNEQGYGRIQLDNALPLAAWSLSPVGIIVKDGGITGDVFGDLSGLSGVMPLAGGTQSESFQLCDDTQELRIALSWMEGATDALQNDLNLEVQDPAGNIYYGNYFTDDDNRDGVIDAGTENCPSINGDAANELDAGPWSLPTCANSDADSDNPMEAVMLSPDSDFNGFSLECTGGGSISCSDDSDCPGAETCTVADQYNQVGGQPAGTWTIRVIGASMTADTNYAVVITGGVCNDSSVRFDAGNYVCNDAATITVNDIDKIDDPAAGLNGGEIATRVTVNVLDENDLIVDTETGLSFVQQGSSLRFVSNELTLTNGTQFDPGNGALDVRHGYSVQVVYQDESTDGGVLPGDIRRVATSIVDCTTAINFGDLVFGKVGANGIFSIDGGCEQNLRGGFEFGFPDEYLDAGESVGYGLAFTSNESDTLIDAIASLRCVEADLNSPEDCLPGTNDCADPNRLDNPACSGVTVTDSPKVVGDIPVGSAMAAYFNVTMDSVLTSGDEVEMILGISSPAAGKSTPGLAVSRHILDVDESSTYYSTDFPTGGSQTKDYNNNEIADVVTTDLTDPNLDYRIETWTWGDPSATNPDLVTFAPFDFDANNGGFQTGVTSSSDTDLVIVQPTLWGEDLNFDGLSQGAIEDARDTAGTNGQLDYGYSTAGGCGWQTQNGLASGDGGVWHTGLIGNNSGSSGDSNCLVDGDTTPGRCQATEAAIGTINGDLIWFELLVSPEINKVNGADHTVEMVDFAWNMTQDIANDLEAFSWELDNDVEKLEPLDLKSDSTVSGLMFGNFGPRANAGNPALGSPAHAGLNAGYAMFSQFVEGGAENFNGSAGNNRVGDQNCWFNNSKALTLSGPFGTALPPDDDIDNDSDGQTDEFVTANGPLRNYDLSAFNGPDLRVTTWEDLFGDSGNTFQAALGYVVLEGTPSDLANGKSYGATVDDVVVEWREYELVADGSDCAGAGECASLDLQALNFFEGAALIQITSIERTPPAANDCNFDGDVLDANDDTDCDDDGTADIVVEVYSADRDDSEVVYLNNTGNATNPDEYKGTVAISPTFDVDGQLVNGHYEGGVLFIVQNGTSNPIVQVDYVDDGCNDNPDPAKAGIRFASTTVFMPIARMNVASYVLTDDNDNDGYADAGETVQMLITLKNNVDTEYKNVVARLSTNSPNIECISGSSVLIGTMGPLEAVTAASSFTFKVADSVNRGTTFEDLTAEFAVTVAGDSFDTLIQPIGLVMDLDLDVTSAGSGASTFSESFDGGGFGQFTTMNMDGAGVGGSNANSDGYRCQYSNPDFINANAYGRAMCYLGNNRTNPLIGDDIYEFHVHTNAQPDGGRSFSGANSMHLGTHDNPSNAGFDTTSLGQLDALVTTSPFNLSTTATSELTFKHQISMIDDRTVNSPGNETPDRALVMVKKVNNSGVEQGVWIKIAPYQNVYHIQGTDNFTECVFDPIDDGSDEDDFFDPGDPFRRLGPSSTCFPEFVYTDLGNTTFDAPFDPNLTGRATEVGGGLEGAVGPGTWVESKFDLARFRGFRLKLRFIYTSIAVDSAATNYNQLFQLPEGWPGDDGWYVDDVSVSNTLTTAAVLDPDTTADNPANTCGAGCSGMDAQLSSDLADDAHTVGAPGGAITLSAETSTVASCIDGTLQFQFWSDDDTNGTIDGSDTLLRDWTDNAFLTDVPAGDTDYAVVTRCTSSPASCPGVNTAFLSVFVDCPSSGALGFNESVGVDAAKANLVWTTTATIDAIEGSLDTLRSAGFATSVNTCLADNVSTNTVSIAATPGSGSGLYYLVRGTGSGSFCNEGTSTWGSASRDTDLSGAANVCP